MNKKTLFLIRNFTALLFLSASIFLFSSRAYASAAVEQRQRQMQQAQRQQQEALQKNSLPEPLAANSTYSYEEKIVSMEQVWMELEISSEIWKEILDSNIKKQVVEKYMKWYSQYDIQIQKPSSHYVEVIDGMSQQQHPIFQKPFRDVLQFVAIIEYDFANSQNPDSMVRALLGEQGYAQNKKRLGK